MYCPSRDWDRGDRVRIGLCVDGALYLASHFGMTIRTGLVKAEYRVNALPEVDGE